MEVEKKTLSDLSVRSVALLQPQGDAAAEQEEGAVHLAAVGRQHRPPDDDTHFAQLAGGLHQQLALQLGRQQLLRTPVSRRPQVSRLSCFMVTISASSPLTLRPRWLSCSLQPVLSVPTPHQPDGLPAAALPAARAQRLWAHPASPAAAAQLRRPPAGPGPLLSARLRPQQ